MSSPGNSECCCHIDTVRCMAGMNSSTTTGNVLMFEHLCLNDVLFVIKGAKYCVPDDVNLVNSSVLKQN